MSSMVRASAPTSAAPPAGIEAEKSPAPRRVAAAVSARTGPATRSPRITAGEHRERGQDQRRHQQLVQQVPRGRVDRARRQQRLDERDRLAAGGEYRHRGTRTRPAVSMRCTAECPSASAAAYSGVKAFTGASV